MYDAIVYWALTRLEWLAGSSEAPQADVSEEYGKNVELIDAYAASARLERCDVDGALFQCRRWSWRIRRPSARGTPS